MRPDGLVDRLRRMLPSTAAVMVAASAALADPPNKIVVVIEENQGYSQVLGNPEAPYFNSLAARGANFTRFYAITHPSQPNYLEFFGGDNQGITNNNQAANAPFSTPNLGSAVFHAGHTFVGYSENLPAMGSLIWAYEYYVRRHNPWVNWQSVEPVPPAGSNQLPWTSNQPFEAFPTDYSRLPKLSIIIPHIFNDMHDGTIAEGDAWLQATLDGYVQWAFANNSLLVITFDEDSDHDRNRIPTLLVGPMITPGDVNSTWTLHNLTRTLAELCDAAPPGQAARVRRIVGMFADDPAVSTSTFRQGEMGYQGASDTFIEAASPQASHAGAASLTVLGSPTSQALIRFDDVFGAEPGRVPPHAIIHSAKLSILTPFGKANQSTGRVSLHRMLVPWDDSATWNSLNNGISLDDAEAAMDAEFTLSPNIDDAVAVFDVTTTVESWLNAADPQAAAWGWALVTASTDAWYPASSEAPATADRPMLEITFSLPNCSPDFNGDGFLDFFDYDAFVIAYEIGDIEADFNRDGFLDFFDYDAFVIAYETGC